MGVAGVGDEEGVSEEASQGADLWEEERDPDSAAVRAGESPLHLGRVVSLTWRSALGVSLPFSVITRYEMSNFSEPSEPLICRCVKILNVGGSLVNPVCQTRLVS